MLESTRKADDDNEQQTKQELHTRTNSPTTTTFGLPQLMATGRISGCFQDAGATFAPARVHSGSLS